MHDVGGAEIEALMDGTPTINRSAPAGRRQYRGRNWK
jgi:hypothetical protein